MFDNGMNRDTVYYVGLADGGWQTTERVCERINQAGYAITLPQTEELLVSLEAKGKIENDFVILLGGKQRNTWKKKP